MAHFGDSIDDLEIQYDHAQQMLSPEVVTAVAVARQALTAERARLVDAAAQIEDRDDGFRGAVKTNIELIEAAIEALVCAVPDRED